ncbi:unnamed protein product [Vicia faba]|uniref:RING-type domain-containing protein n=1 Tax=Vicia faba TaxID=3906 RepID=A0AAV0Z083_VICFA|nr:unnamed protein product [Vicia faba]
MGSSDFSWKLPDHPKLPKGKTIAVVVLDGWGEANPNEYNCIHIAETPTMDSLKKGAPEHWRLVRAHGKAVGLPTEDDMGNSEVGHNALGAGRIFAQGKCELILLLETFGFAVPILLCHGIANECNKAKREFQEKNNYVERLRQKLDNVSKFPMKIAQESGEKIAITSSVMSAGESKVPAVEVSKTISLSRNPTLTSQCCTICLGNEKDMAFGCGHMTCRECGTKIRKCHICRKKITNRIRLFPG